MKNFIFIFSLLLTTTVFAQGYTFRVLANKGQNQVKKDGGSSVALKTGATLNAKDQLVAGSGAYIGLMHKTGKTIEVREPGTYTMASLEEKVAAKNVNVASKYAQFIASKMNDDGSVNPLNRMAATGAVSRAVGGALPVFVPQGSIEILSDNAVIRWKAPEGAEEGAEYGIKIENIFDEVIYTDATTDMFINLDFNQIENETGLYLVTISTKVDGESVESERIGIKRVDADERGDLVANYEALKDEVSEETPLDKLVYASFFEENGMVLDALTKYEEAIQMSPEVEDFKALYDAFLIGYNLKETEE
jgi:predicted secreted protein